MNVRNIFPASDGTDLMSGRITLYSCRARPVVQTAFNRIQKTFLFHFWLLASAVKFSICPKNDGFARLGGLSPNPPGWLAYELRSPVKTALGTTISK